MDIEQKKTLNILRQNLFPWRILILCERDETNIYEGILETWI